MLNIEKAAGQVVVSDTQRSVSAVDHAVMSLANLCASIVEVSKASNLPVYTVQASLTNAGSGLTKLIASRGDISDAVSAMVAIQNSSNLQTVSFGCPCTPPPSARKDTSHVSQDQTA